MATDHQPHQAAGVKVAAYAADLNFSPSESPHEDGHGPKTEPPDDRDMINNNSATDVDFSFSYQAPRSCEKIDGSSSDDDTHLLEDTTADEFGLATGPDGDAAKAKADRVGEQPAWCELKTKAGKERKRLPLACIACRRKKIRCSGEKPACKHCLRSRVPCVYKVTARKAAPRTDYMAMLDRRLRRMEDRILKVVPNVEHDMVTRAVVKPAMPGAVHSRQPKAAKKRTADEAFGADLDQWARVPSCRATQPAKCDSDGDAFDEYNRSEETKMLLDGRDALPPREIQEHLADVFFENVYGQAYHLLHKPSYMRKLRAGVLPPVLVLSVCAVAARFSTHPGLDTKPSFLRGEAWASVVRDILARCHGWPNMTILTCLLIMGLHEFGTCHGGRSWSFGGQAIRMAFALQLHKDLDHDPLLPTRAPLGFVDREMRRRIMWACFLMDRFSSSGTDRPTFVREETLKTTLPVHEKNFLLDMPEPAEMLGAEPGSSDTAAMPGVAACMVRAIAVWGRIISYVNQGGKEADPQPMWDAESQYSALHKQAENAVASLPAALAYTADNLHQHETENTANQFLFLHVALQQNLLFLNRFAVSSPRGHLQADVPKHFVAKAGARAFAAANRISDLLRHGDQHALTAPFAGYCAFLSATVHVFGIFQGNAAMEVSCKRNLAINVRFLSRMKRYWGMFHCMTESLREQYRACADAQRATGKKSESPQESSPVFQYGDWFDRYPHGVSPKDQVDPIKKEDDLASQRADLHTVEEFINHVTTLSPQSSVADAPLALANTNRGRNPTAKRTSVGGAKAASRTDIVLEPLQTDFTGSGQLHAAMAQAHVHQQGQQRRAPTFPGAANGTGGGAQLGAQQNAPYPLSIPAHSAVSYHSISPVSPVGLAQFHGGGQRHHQQQEQQQQQTQQPPLSFFSPDPFSLSFNASTPAAMTALDRQIMFGAYGGISSSSSSSMWPSAEPGAAETTDRHAQPPESTVTNAASGPDSSAWYSPFDLEPPPDMSADMGLVPPDAFAAMFSSGNATAAAAAQGSTGGRMHRG